MYSTNLCVFTGRLVDVPVVEVENGPVRFSLALNGGYTDPTTKKWVDQKAFINCIAWNGLKKKLVEMKKGTEILIEAKIKQDFYNDKDDKPTSSALYFEARSAKVANSFVKKEETTEDDIPE